jgi:hypothetical protein
MAIVNYPTIKVAGQGNLKVFGVDFEAATISSPGKITVTFIDKDNSLPIPTLSAKSSTTLTIGSFSFTGYPVRYKRNYSASGESLLVVTYIDGSFILDKYYVGLKGQHSNANVSYDSLYKNNILSKGLILKGLKTYDYSGLTVNTNNIPKWMIIVGTYIDPCQELFDSETKIDPCNPCPEGDNDLGKQSTAIDCEKLRSTALSQVDYSFDEFISALGSKGIRISVDTSYDSEYRASYSGSLRDVLQSWCSDFGFSFYFNKDQISIYDLRVGINIDNLSLNENQIIEKTEEGSIEHTKSTACIAYYGVEGSEREYSCSADSGHKISCRPLTLRDIGAKGLMGEYACTTESSFYNLLEFLIMFSGYSPILREMVTWFDVYQIRNANAAKRLIDTQDTNTAITGLTTKYGNYYTLSPTADIDSGTYSLPLLNMTIKKVIQSGDPEWTDLLNSNNLDESIKKRALDTIYAPYFFIASQNETGFANKVNWEATLANDFLGKFFLRWYETYNSSNPSILACQGDDVKFYKQGGDGLDFGNFIPVFATEAADLGYDKTKYVKPSNYSSLPIFKFSSKQGAAKDSFVLVTRSARWSPPIQEGAEVKNIINMSSKHRMMNLGLASSYGNFVNNHPKLKSNPVFGERDMLFLAFSMPSGFNISASTETHPTENAIGRSCDIYVQQFETPVDLGLESKRTTRVSIGGIANFYYPPQSRVSDVSNNGGYNVYVSHERSKDHTYVVPKMQLVETSYYDDDEVLRNDVNYKTNVNLDGLNALKLESVKGSSLCVPNYSDIKSRMTNYVNNMKSKSTGMSKTITYELAGVPGSNYGPENGLVSLSVRVGSQGISTSLTFSDMKDRDIRQSDILTEEQIINRAPSNAVGDKLIKHNLLSTNLNDSTFKL